MKRIYLVIGSECEGAAVFGAFEAERDADALVAACFAYDAGPRPQAPDDIKETPENDAAWERFVKRDERWRNRHPAGKGGNGYDHWSVQRIRLQAPSNVLHAKPEAQQVCDGAEAGSSDEPKTKG